MKDATLQVSDEVIDKLVVKMNERRVKNEHQNGSAHIAVNIYTKLKAFHELQDVANLLKKMSNLLGTEHRLD